MQCILAGGSKLIYFKDIEKTIGMNFDLTTNNDKQVASYPMVIVEVMKDTD
jgi:hypothetical protein